MQEAGMSVLAFVVNNSLQAYGGDQAITIYGMVNKFTSLIFLPMLGMIQGFQPIAGYNFGAHRFDRVKKSLRVAIATAVSLAAFGYVFTVLLPDLSMSLFTSDASLIATSSRVLRIFTSLLPWWRSRSSGSTYFQAVASLRHRSSGPVPPVHHPDPAASHPAPLPGLGRSLGGLPPLGFPGDGMTTAFLVRDVRHLTPCGSKRAPSCHWRSASSCPGISRQYCWIPPKRRSMKAAAFTRRSGSASSPSDSR
jgi:hypothetical protein